MPVRVLNGFGEPNAFATGLGASRRVFLWKPIVEPPFTPRMDRFVLAHELGHLAHNHIWKSIALVRALRLPARVPARARRAAARRDGGAGGRPARDLRATSSSSSSTLPLQNVISAAPRGGGGLVGAARDARPRRRPAALPALRLGDEGRSEPAVVGLRLPREPPDAAAADRDDAVLDKSYAAAQSP